MIILEERLRDAEKKIEELEQRVQDMEVVLGTNVIPMVQNLQSQLDLIYAAVSKQVNTPVITEQEIVKCMEQEGISWEKAQAKLQEEKMNERPEQALSTSSDPT